jgi:hypothetical protein
MKRQSIKIVALALLLAGTVMTFQNPYHQPLLIEKIYNDTLVFYEYEVNEAKYYHCVKNKL